VLEWAGVIQITPHMRILVAVEPQDFRRGIDGMARVCKERLASDPFSGAAYVFRNRRGTAVKILVYDGQGFWLCHKRLSNGKIFVLAFVARPSRDGARGT
jgi:transposase